MKLVPSNLITDNGYLYIETGDGAIYQDYVGSSMKWTVDKFNSARFYIEEADPGEVEAAQALGCVFMGPFVPDPV